VPTATARLAARGSDARRANDPTTATSTPTGYDGGWARVGAGNTAGMRFGKTEVRPLGGGAGCLGMIVFSVVASVLLTVLVNLVLR
jgi:uncharacterized membrane protein